MREIMKGKLMSNFLSELVENNITMQNITQTGLDADSIYIITQMVNSLKYVHKMKKKYPELRIPETDPSLKKTLS